ncbi:hypothetical protein, partial [Escherichia marmotae]|uniref:hypothetical protein n=1 Tax=Escherichia marmotae TaxID=1499973 RepID=UPI00200151CF
LLIYGDITRYLMFDGAEAKTGNTPNRNVEACGNGAGNSFVACGGSPDNKKRCNAYNRGVPCK